MKFLVFGINHNKSSIELREKVFFTESKIIDACDKLLSDTVDEALILSTCNRSEIYLIAKDDYDKATAVSFIQDFFDVENISENIFYLQDKAAISHLLNLSLGRESLIVGEDQILGQIKDSLEIAQGINSSKKYLNYIFREAINFSKKIKTQSDVASTPISTAYIGLKDINEKLHIKDKKALVIGVGKMGALSINYLIDYGAKISISNWTYENSLKIKEKYPFIELIKFEDIKDVLDDFDLIISATKSPHTLIKKEFFNAPDKEKYILDLSLPRDVDKEVGLIKKIHLYNIDKLRAIADKNIQLRKEILDSYSPEILTKTCQIFKEINDVDFSKLLNQISIKCDECSNFTLSYIERRVDLDHSQRIKVEKIIKSALNKVSRDPILKVKNSDLSWEKKKSLLEALEEVYRL